MNVVNVILVKTIKDEKVVQRVKEYFVRGGNVISFGEIELDELELKAENIKDLAIMISSRLGGCWISSTFECRAISKGIYYLVELGIFVHVFSYCSKLVGTSGNNSVP